MKKFWSILLCFTLAFTFTSPTIGEAKRSSGSSYKSKSYNSGGNSYKSYNSNSSTTTKPSSGTGNNHIDSTTNSTPTTRPNSGTGSNTEPTDKSNTTVAPSNKTYVPSSYLKRKSPYQTPYYQPKTNVDYSRYNQKPYYNPSFGFASTLLTAAGVYLILDSFSDDGEPIYVDSETGEKLTQEQMDELEVEPVEIQEESEEENKEQKTSEPATTIATDKAYQEKEAEEQESGSNTWMWFLIGILASIIGLFLVKKIKR